jgi:hypothetical protein
MTITQRPQVTAILCDLDDCLYQNHEMQYNVAENIRRAPHLPACALPYVAATSILFDV